MDGSERFLAGARRTDGSLPAKAMTVRAARASGFRAVAARVSRCVIVTTPAAIGRRVAS